MQSLTQLNGFSQTEAISVTDLRKARVVFNETPNLEAINQVLQIASTTLTINPGIEILDIINYTLSQPTLTVEITTTGSPLLTGSSIAWANSASWPAYLTVAVVGTKYTVSGMRSANDWLLVRQFTWTLPGAWASSPSFRLVCRINYYDEATNKNVFKQWYVYDPDNSYIAELSLAATMTVKGSYIVRSNRAAITTVATAVLDQPLELQIYTLGGNYGSNTTFRVNGTSLRVDWGDGSAVQTLGTLTDASYQSGGAYYSAFSIPHTWPATISSVYYTIKIYGNITSFASAFDANIDAEPGRRSLTQLLAWPLSNITRVSLAGGNLSYVPPTLPRSVTNLNSFLQQGTATGSADTNIAGWDTKNVTNFSYAFQGYEQQNSYNAPVQNWDTRSATNMEGMFLRNTAFNRAINTNVNIWNTSNVTTMSGMFNGATAFNQSISNWDTLKVLIMTEMFRDAAAFNQPLLRNGNKWYTGGVTSTGQQVAMDSMFNGAITFNQNLSNWNVLYMPSKPNLFDNNTPAWNKTNRLPRWATNGS